MKIDRRFSNGLHGDQLLHAQPLDGLRERERRHRHADRLRAELGRGRTSTARTTTRSPAIYELPWGPNKRWLNEGLLGKIIGGWQISSIFIAQSGDAARASPASGTLFNTPGNTAYADLYGEQTILGGLGPGHAVLRSGGLCAAGGGNAGQHEAQQRSGGPGLLAARRVAVQALRDRRLALRRIPRRRVQRDELGALGQPEHRLQRATGNTFGQISGTTGGQRTLRFGGRFVF